VLHDHLNPEAKKSMEKIISSSLRMKQLIEDLLNFSRADATRNKYLTVDLNSVVEDVLHDFSVVNSGKYELNSDTLPTISAIPVQMKQLFHNLFSNAFKFRKEDTTLKISIRARSLTAKEIGKHPMLDSESVYYEIKFNDNGIGFDEKYAEQIFTIFQRLHGNEKYSGTGIGLALCKKIIQNHHGEIYAESGNGKGASFIFILPEKQEVK
jgi:two-component system CheB/CheR fusion protein